MAKPRLCKWKIPQRIVVGRESLSRRVRAAPMVHTPNQRRAANATGVPALQNTRCTQAARPITS
jgi:hypothetical protein